MTIAFLASLGGVGFLFAQRRRRAELFTVISIVLTAVFIAWVQLSPPVGSE